MQDSDQSFMQDAPDRPLYRATRRLVGALERLESNLEQIGAMQDHTEDARQLGLFAQENESLKRERENLTGAIDQLKLQYDDLQQVASAIYGKLDDSVKRLSKIIEP